MANMSSGAFPALTDPAKTGLIASASGFLWPLLTSILVILLVRESLRTNLPPIRGIPSVPHSLPFIGHLHLLGGRQSKNDATVFSEWATRLHTNVLQLRVGDQRTVVVNDFSTIKALWIGRAKALIHRPAQPGFLEKLGVDLTGSSMTPQLRKCRAAALRALARPMWPRYYHLLEPSSAALVRNLHTTGQNGTKVVDVYPHLRHVVFDLCLSLTYGARFGSVDDAFMLRFIASINAISAVRSSTKTWRHYVPLLRLLPEGTSATAAAERVRARHMGVLYDAYKTRVAAGETVACIVAALDEDRLTLDEVHGTCLSLLQAAPDTVASTVYQAVAWLCSPAGRDTQRQVYQAILDAYDGDRDTAWRMAFREEKVGLLVSLYKETLRFFTLAPYATPRRTAEDVSYEGFTLPAGVTLVMNAQAANHDTQHYGSDAWAFRPDRFVGGPWASDPLPHLAFGAGSRICPAVAISNRLVYALLLRLVLAFEMEEPRDGEMTEGAGECGHGGTLKGGVREARRPDVDPLGFSDVYGELVAHPKFYDVRCTARDDEWLRGVMERELA